MTDTSASLNPHTAPSASSLIGSVNPLVGSTSHTPSALLPEDQVEDYTIKCICGYQDDDGNSVFCERCDTWQHTECYYADENGRVPTGDELKDIEHFCTDCKPRRIDAKTAINRQRIRKEDLDTGERKIKKTTSKSHKKKIKVPDYNGILTNGWAPGAPSEDRMSRSPLDHVPPGKRVKTHHRPSSSVNHPLTPSNPTSHPHKRSLSTLNSPSKIPTKHLLNNHTRETYSAEFLKRYDNDPGDRPLSANLFSDIKITRDLSLWSHDVEALQEATNGCSHPQVFHRIENPLHTLRNPELRKEQAQNESVAIDGRHPRWTYLTIDNFTPKSSIIGELKGEIGHMKDYIQNPDNQWAYLCHPAPFVFFHPKLPIYIDTRIEGTTCRYLRRSCDPNLIMTTILENDSEYHFCFTAKQDINAGAELTIGWTLDENMRKIFNPHHNGVKQEIGGDHGRYIADWANHVLPEFGGCACDAESSCAFARYSTVIKTSPKDRNGFGKSQIPQQGGFNAENRDENEHNGNRSTSASKSGSRDITPTGNGGGVPGAGPGLEISDRDKRKIAALEKGFEKLEQDKYQPALKRKKRNSAGSSANTPTAGISVSLQTQVNAQAHPDSSGKKQIYHTATSFSQPNTPSFPSKTQNVHVKSVRPRSGSPVAAYSDFIAEQRSTNIANPRKYSPHSNKPEAPYPLVHRNYVSKGVQTDPDGHDWYRPLSKPTLAKKPYVSLTKRLLFRSQQDRKRLEESRRFSESSNGKAEMQPGSKSTNSAAQKLHVDTNMPDIGTVPPSKSGQEQPSPTYEAPKLPERSSDRSHSSSKVELQPVSQTLPSRVGSLDEQQVQANGFRSTDLHVQLPPKPVLFTDSSSTSPSIQTPTSAVPPSPYATKPASTYPPFLSSASSLVNPSPAKKKVSLKDYMKRKGSQTVNDKQMGGSPEMQQNALKPRPTSMEGDIKANVKDNSPTADTPFQRMVP